MSAPNRSGLPAPSPDALAHSKKLVALITSEIAANAGWIPFARYMELALYAPGLGYYTAGARKLGREGDFVTAPEMTPLYGQTLARQAAEVLESGVDQILEIGAGSGALAAALLAELERLGRVPRNYYILEVSPDLRERERDLLALKVPQLLERVIWLNRLPPLYQGLIIANEVLDAMPVHRVRIGAADVEEAGVELKDDVFAWSWRPAAAELRAALVPLHLPQGYQTEIQLLACGFVRSLAQAMERGVILLIDYGFPAHEYYHAQRSDGTLMCHYRHRAHADPFFLPGLQDITSHVDFSAVARAGSEAGLELLGYTGQAQFLINCGITDIMLRTPPENTAAYLPQAAAAQQLLSPSEMGELFKVVAMGKNHADRLIGFSSGNRRGTL
ncbi:MAG: class I SAM-dependent methyltransferase [Betaproteobacteria bacterium]|nr:MAG: class I SAM-dependent methyltransferase [Betaproteobacteria bacterium]